MEPYQLIELRRMAGSSQEELADKIGVGRCFVGKIEAGKAVGLKKYFDYFKELGLIDESRIERVDNLIHYKNSSNGKRT